MATDATCRESTTVGIHEVERVFGEGNRFSRDFHALAIKSFKVRRSGVEKLLCSIPSGVDVARIVHILRDLVYRIVVHIANFRCVVSHVPPEYVQIPVESVESSSRFSNSGVMVERTDIAEPTS